ncbi:MAG: hypothetical protein GC181_14710 [Bacteroidetes bacterium]|nr:hypothetical protein [Bacteroidota bacterium]
MRCLLGILLIFFALTSANAQNHNWDTVRYSLKQKPKFIAGLNNRYALASGQPLIINGVLIGMDFNNILKIGFGYNWMPKEVREIRIENHSGGNDTDIIKSRISYFNLSTDYVFRHTKKWKFSIPLLIGIGIRERTEILHNTPKPILNSNPVIPIEFGITSTYYITDWLGLKGGLGNRIVIGNGFRQFSGPYYTLGLTIFPKPIIKRIQQVIKKAQDT